MSLTTPDDKLIIDDVSVTDGDSYESAKRHIIGLCAYIQFKYASAGSPAGTIKLQGSTDPAVMGWEDVVNGSHTIEVTDGAGSGAFNVSNAVYPYFRLLVEPTGADITGLTAVYETKEWN